MLGGAPLRAPGTFGKRAGVTVVKGLPALRPRSRVPPPSARWTSTSAPNAVPGPHLRGPSCKPTERLVAHSSADGAAAAMGEIRQSPGEGLMQLWARVRATLFYLWTALIAVPLFVVMLVIYPIVLKLDKYRRRAQHAVNTLWAKLGSFPFYRVKIEGRQHLPPNVQAAVYVANHQSFLDIFSLFHLNRSFKFISKSSIFYIPIVGWSMFLTGHVMLNRVDRRSQLRVLQECERLLSRGASLLFFPEGTRSVDQKLAPFKKGGFTVAVRTGAPVVPITVLGAGDMMPSGKEAFMYPGEVRMIVHPPMEAKGENAQELCDKARAVIASAMPQRLVS